MRRTRGRNSAKSLGPVTNTRATGSERKIRDTAGSSASEGRLRTRRTRSST